MLNVAITALFLANVVFAALPKKIACADGGNFWLLNKKNSNALDNVSAKNKEELLAKIATSLNVVHPRGTSTIKSEIVKTSSERMDYEGNKAQEYYSAQTNGAGKSPTWGAVHLLPPWGQIKGNMLANLLRISSEEGFPLTAELLTKNDGKLTGVAAATRKNYFTSSEIKESVATPTFGSTQIGLLFVIPGAALLVGFIYCRSSKGSEYQALVDEL